jgi:hypothetical protein
MWLLLDQLDALENTLHALVWGEGLRAHKANKPTTILEAIILKMWGPPYLTILWVSMACYSHSFTYYGKLGKEVKCFGMIIEHFKPKEDYISLYNFLLQVVPWCCDFIWATAQVWVVVTTQEPAEGTSGSAESIVTAFHVLW